MTKQAPIGHVLVPERRWKTMPDIFFSTCERTYGEWSAAVAETGSRRILEAFMNATVTYRFDLYNDGGTRNCLFIAECFGDEHAMQLARALFDSTFVGTNCIEVWREDVLVHEARKPPATGIN
jgi:hypothetical protein